MVKIIIIALCAGALVLFAMRFFPAFVDAIGGWKTSGVGHGYGSGYPLEVLEKWLEKI